MSVMPPRQLHVWKKLLFGTEMIEFAPLINLTPDYGNMIILHENAMDIKRGLNCYSENNVLTM